MSARNWQPGDVAMIRVGTGDWERGLLQDDGTWVCLHAQARQEWEDVQVAPRPLVVIDPEDREQVARLVKAAWPHAYHQSDMRESLQAALREFANPTPPIEEPTGLGAVVEDVDGVRWIRFDEPDRKAAWFPARGAGPALHWTEFTPARVLSEGVPAEAKS